MISFLFVCLSSILMFDLNVGFANCTEIVLVREI